MIDFMSILIVIARQVRKRFGDQSLNELIAQGIAVYLEVSAALPTTRKLSGFPHADPDLVNSVIDELSELQA